MFLNGSPETAHFGMNKKESRHRSILERIAYRAMIERGFEPDFSLAIIEELNHPPKLYDVEPGRLRDLRHLLWCSLDNEESRDLDQLTVAEPLSDGNVRILVAIADVDTLVRKDSPFDNHARQNTTSVYTAARIFPMLPERLSTDLTSLNYCEDRLAMVIEMIVWDDGSPKNSGIYEAIVRNHARLSYDRVASWLEGKSPEPDSIAAEKGTWVRVFHPPVEGKLVEGFEDVDVGQKVRVELVRTDVERGFIDSKKLKIL
jgi:exoribonuclease R